MQYQTLFILLKKIAECTKDKEYITERKVYHNPHVVFKHDILVFHKYLDDILVHNTNYFLPLTTHNL